MNKKMRQEAEDIIKTFDNFYPEKVEKVFYERNINYIKFFYYPKIFLLSKWYRYLIYYKRKISTYSY
jgi:hypothetical protein